MCRELRHALECIPQADITEQEHRLIELSNRFDHTITVIDDPALFLPGGGTYNCYAYAFNLCESEEYLLIARDHDNAVFANSDFIQYLLDRNMLIELYKARIIENGIIIYFLEGNPSHAGKIQGSRVISKWGTGLLFGHEILDIPISYGNAYKIYNAVTADDALELFYDFAEIRGWEFERV